MWNWIGMNIRIDLLIRFFWFSWWTPERELSGKKWLQGRWSVVQFCLFTFLRCSLGVARDAKKQQRGEGERAGWHKDYSAHSRENLRRSRKIFSFFYSVAWLEGQFSKYETENNEGSVFHSVWRMSWLCAVPFFWESSRQFANMTSLHPGEDCGPKLRRVIPLQQFGGIHAQINFLSRSECPRIVWVTSLTYRKMGVDNKRGEMSPPKWDLLMNSTSEALKRHTEHFYSFSFSPKWPFLELAFI